MMTDRIYYCHTCGKKMFRSYWDEYVYKKELTENKKRQKKHKTIYFCGWNCMRQYEKESEEQKRHGKSRHNSNNTEA